MNKLICFIILTLMLWCVSCALPNNEYDALPNIISKNEATPVSMTNYTRSNYKIFVSENDYTLSKYEPENGCYLGSYVLANRQINFDMSEFDSAVGKNHGLAVYNFRLGEVFPHEWVLECAANNKTPYIIVRPANEYALFDKSSLVSTAIDLAKISAPVFVDLYPNPHSYTSNYEKYVEFFRDASRIFSEYAPKVAMVVSSDSNNVYDFDLYYPGDEFVDWVGIIMYRPLYLNGEVNLRNYTKDLDFFYSMYQRSKPIIVSQLAFSSYSTVDHRYASQESGERLKEFYEQLSTEYTRIKAVNYMDFNNIDRAPATAIRDNFSVTQDETMLAAYSEAVSDSHFLSDIRSESRLEKTETFRSYFQVYEDENYKYLPLDVFVVESAEIPESETVVINGDIYFKAELLQKNNLVLLDDEKKHITFSV